MAKQLGDTNNNNNNDNNNERESESNNITTRFPSLRKKILMRDEYDPRDIKYEKVKHIYES